MLELGEGKSGRAGLQRSPLFHAMYRRIWMASLLIYVGGAAQLVGVAWVLTTSGQPPSIVAMAQSASTLPILLFALPVGALADLHDRRHLMLLALALALLSGIAILLLTAAAIETAFLLLSCTFVAGAASSLFAPSMQASVMTILPRERIGAAVTLNSLALNLARSGGPAIASLALAVIGSAAVFVMSAACFFAGVVMLRAVRIPPSPAIDTRMLQTMRDGLVHSWHSPPLRAVLLRSLIFTGVGSAIWSLWPLLARAQRADARTFGLYLGALGIGAIVGSMFAQRIRSSCSPGQILAFAGPIFGCACLATVEGNTWVALVGLFVAGVAWVQALTTCTAYAQLLAPPHLAGRIASISGMSTFGGLAIGGLLWGLAADEFGVERTMELGSFLMLLYPLTSLWLPIYAIPHTMTGEPYSQTNSIVIEIHGQ